MPEFRLGWDPSKPFGDIPGGIPDARDSFEVVSSGAAESPPAAPVTDIPEFRTEREATATPGPAPPTPEFRVEEQPEFRVEEQPEFRVAGERPTIYYQPPPTPGAPPGIPPEAIPGAQPPGYAPPPPGYAPPTEVPTYGPPVNGAYIGEPPKKRSTGLIVAGTLGLLAAAVGIGIAVHKGRK